MRNFYKIIILSLIFYGSNCGNKKDIIVMDNGLIIEDIVEGDGTEALIVSPVSTQISRAYAKTGVTLSDAQDKVAKAYGLEVANCNIEIFDGIKVLVIDRFDRRFSEDNSWLMRLPQEDLCQALGYSPNLKYEADGGPGIKDIMRLLHGANNSDLNKEMFFRSQVLFFMKRILVFIKSK